MAEQYSVEIVESNDGPIAIKIADVCVAFLRTGDEIRQRADFALIADAFNVANETGLTPRELAEQRERLLAAMKIARDFIETVNVHYMGDNFFEARQRQHRARVAVADGVIQKAIADAEGATP